MTIIRKQNKNHLCFVLAHSFLSKILQKSAQDTADQADIVLIAGDLSFNGEKESNEAFSKLLHEFTEKSGKKVYVVTAGHDFNDNPFCFTDKGRGKPE